MKQLPQQRTSTRQVFPFPTEGETVWETPPCLIWIANESVAGEYNISVRGENGFHWEGHTALNYIVPEILFPAGSYEWNVTTSDAERGWVRFTIAEGAVEFIRPTGKQIFDAVPGPIRPRHLFYKTDVEQILRNRAGEIEVLKRNIALALQDGIPVPPSFYSGESAFSWDTSWREYFGRHREYVDRNLIACGLGWQLLGDREAGEHGVRLMLEICSWDPEKECSLFGGFCDEIGLSNARCLPSAYDLLQDLMTPKQRRLAQSALVSYALQCERRILETDFVGNPGNSHVGRIPAYLGDAALVLKGTQVPEEMLRRWIDLVAEIYGGIFPFYGGPDGSWAEGPFYASSYTKWYLPFFNAVDRFLDISYLDRPFYQRLSHYMLHFADPGAEIHPFGDGYWCHSTDVEWPGFFAQDPFRVYAEKFGPEEAVIREKAIPQPDVFLLHLLDVFLPVSSKPKQHITGSAACAVAFPYGGLVSMRSSLTEQKNCMAVMARASRFGSGSHSHADQGSFCLFYEGTALISPSGYYGRGYGTDHHTKWTNTTNAHNCILVDGAGQSTWSHESVGRVERCSREDHIFVSELDLSDAYPTLKQWKRRLVMDAEKLELTVEDSVTAQKDVTLDWLLHCLSRPENGTGSNATLTRNGIRLDILPQTGLTGKADIQDRFPVDVNAGQPEQFHVQVPPQYHMRWKTESAKAHHIVVKFIIAPPENRI